jgi:type IV pilus assembly protein PilM
MSDSIWKKEISFSRKAKAPKESAAPAEQKKESLLKKEISFSRKAKAPKESVAPAEQKKESLLKKEISFSRKKKRAREIDRLAQEAEQSMSLSFLSAEPISVETLPTSLAEAAVAVMAEVPAEEERAAAAPAALEQVPAEQVTPEHAAPEPTFTEHAPVSPIPLALAPEPAPVELHPVEAQPVELFPVDPQPFGPAEDAYAVPALLTPDESPVAFVEEQAGPVEPLLPAAFTPHVTESPPVAPVDEAALESVLQPEPQAWPESADPVPEPVEPWLAAPELPHAPDVSPPVVHPPVTAAELPLLPAEAGTKTPFWKKELSLSRTAKQPKTTKAGRREKSGTASAPFWKKELSLGRRSSAPGASPEADAPIPALPAADSVPFWKKQVGFSLPALSLPRRGSGRGGKGGHAAKNLVGLKIGASQLAAARISNNGVAELQQMAREPLAAGIVVGGELRDPDALGDALKVFFAKNKLPRKGVRLGIASNRIGVRIFDIVGVEQEKQLANAVHFRAQEALPIPLDEAVLDYRVLGESIDAEGQSVKRVLLVVAYRELVDRYVSACRTAGITLAGIDLEAFALLRALAAPVDGGAAALVAVAIGHDRSTFAVSDGRVCEFTRVLEWGGWSLNVALARVFDCAPSEAEAIKRSLSLESNVAPVGLTEEQTAQALDAVKRQVQSFARELVSSLQFYQNQPGSLGIGEIVLTGGTTGLQGLAEELERLIGVHVRIGDPLARLKVPKRLSDPEQIGSYAVAIGLGIED